MKFQSYIQHNIIFYISVCFYTKTDANYFKRLGIQLTIHTDYCDCEWFDGRISSLTIIKTCRIFIFGGIVPLRLHMDHASAPEAGSVQPINAVLTSILFQIKMYTVKYFTLFIEYECVNPLLYSHVSSVPLSTQLCAIVKPQQ